MDWRNWIFSVFFSFFTLECPLPPYFAQVLTKLRQLV